LQNDLRCRLDALNYCNRETSLSDSLSESVSIDNSENSVIDNRENSLIDNSENPVIDIRENSLIDNSENSLQLNTSASAITPSLQVNVIVSAHGEKVPSCDTETGTKSSVVTDVIDASFAEAKTSGSTVSQVPADTTPDTKLSSYSESVVLPASAGSESVSEVSAKSAITEAGSWSCDNKTSEVSFVTKCDDVEAGTEMSGELPVTAVTSNVPAAATVTSYDQEAGTKSASGCHSPGLYVRKPIAAVNHNGNLKTTPKTNRRAFYRSSPTCVVYNDSKDDDVSQKTLSEVSPPSSSLTDAGLTLQEQDSSHEQAKSDDFSELSAHTRHVRQRSEPGCSVNTLATEAVSMEIKSTTEQSVEPTNDKETASLSSKLRQYNTGSASVPSTPQYVSSRFHC